MSMDYIMLLQSLGLTPLNMALAVMLYFIGQKAGIFPKLWKSNEEETEKEEIPTWALRLQQHFNDETSIILKEIRDGVHKLDERGEKSCQKSDKILSVLMDAHDDDVEWRHESREFMRDLIKK